MSWSYKLPSPGTSQQNPPPQNIKLTIGGGTIIFFLPKSPSLETQIFHVKPKERRVINNQK